MNRWLAMAQADLHDETAYHPLYIGGDRAFNKCDFFESHESWEKLWTDYRGPSRKFYKGLIQAAVAYSTLATATSAARKKLHLRSSRAYLALRGPKHIGLDLEKFFDLFDRCFAEVAVCNADEFP